MTEHIVCPDHPWGENERCCDDCVDVMCSRCGGSPSLIVSVSQRDEEVAEEIAGTHGDSASITQRLDLAWHISIALAAAREGYPR